MPRISTISHNVRYSHNQYSGEKHEFQPQLCHDLCDLGHVIAPLWDKSLPVSGTQVTSSKMRSACVNSISRLLVKITHAIYLNEYSKPQFRPTESDCQRVRSHYICISTRLPEIPLCRQVWDLVNQMTSGSLPPLALGGLIPPSRFLYFISKKSVSFHSHPTLMQRGSLFSHQEP